MSNAKPISFWAALPALVITICGGLYLSGALIIGIITTQNDSDPQVAQYAGLAWFLLIFEYAIIGTVITVQTLIQNALSKPRSAVMSILLVAGAYVIPAAIVMYYGVLR